NHGTPQTAHTVIVPEPVEAIDVNVTIQSEGPFGWLLTGMTLPRAVGWRDLGGSQSAKGRKGEDRADEGGIRSWRLPAICPTRLPARRPSVTSSSSRRFWTSSAWALARSPGSMLIDDRDDTRHPGSRTPSTIGSTLSWTGICS